MMRSAAKPDLLGPRGREQGGLHHRLPRHRARFDRRRRAGVLVHQVGQQRLVERAPVGADADRLAVPDRRLDDGAELAVLLLLEADIAGVDPVLVERLGAGRMIGEELVADIVEIADERHVDAEPAEPLADVRHGGRRLVPIDGDADDLRAGAGEGGDLRHRPVDVGGVRVGHRLDDDRRAAADGDAADADAGRPLPRRRSGGAVGEAVDGGHGRSGQGRKPSPS